METCLSTPSSPSTPLLSPLILTSLLSFLCSLPTLLYGWMDAAVQPERSAYLHWRGCQNITNGFSWSQWLVNGMISQRLHQETPRIQENRFGLTPLSRIGVLSLMMLSSTFWCTACAFLFIAQGGGTGIFQALDISSLHYCCVLFFSFSIHKDHTRWPAALYIISVH